MMKKLAAGLGAIVLMGASAAAGSEPGTITYASSRQPLASGGVVSCSYTSSFDPTIRAVRERYSIVVDDSQRHYYAAVDDDNGDMKADEGYIADASGVLCASRPGIVASGQYTLPPCHKNNTVSNEKALKRLQAVFDEHIAMFGPQCGMKR